MQRLLVDGGPTPDDIVLPERLDRSRLDFSLESLHLVDEYLNVVHEHEQILPSALAPDHDLGHVALHRRDHSPRRLRIASTSGSRSATSQARQRRHHQHQQVDLGSLSALRARTASCACPSRAVLRVILRGRKARSVHSFACGAIEARPTPPSRALPALPTWASASHRRLRLAEGVLPAACLLSGAKCLIGREEI